MAAAISIAVLVVVSVWLYLRYDNHKNAGYIASTGIVEATEVSFSPKAAGLEAVKGDIIFLTVFAVLLIDLGTVSFKRPCSRLLEIAAGVCYFCWVPVPRSFRLKLSAFEQFVSFNGNAGRIHIC